MPTKATELPDQAIVTSTDGPEAPDRLRQIRERYRIHTTFWSNIHDEGRKDDEMVAGHHWPLDIKKEREEARRPCLTYNMIPSFNRQITNRIRQERPQIKVIPVESRRGKTPKIANVGGTNDYAITDVYTGIVRNIEHVSRADQAYDTAIKSAVDRGFGFFYLMPEWSRLDPFVQELKIYRVKNAYTITLDPDALEADYRDAQDAFMGTLINRSTFEKKYPDADTSNFAGTASGSFEGWWDTENILVTQYFWIEYQDDQVALLSNGHTVYMSDVEDILDELEEQEGIYLLEEDGEQMIKPVKRPVCMWQKMTAHTILEGPTELPFSMIPIFPVLGDEVPQDGRISYESAHRQSHDAARSYNYWRTAAAEAVALAPKAPWIAAAQQIKGYEDIWETANANNDSVLPYNHIDGMPPPQRNFPGQVAAAELANAGQDATDMQTIIGLHDASLGRESNEKSGKAILARQNQGNTATFQFPDNLNRAIQQCGRCIVEAIPKLYDSQRIVRIRMPDDTDDFVEINQTVRDEETGKDVLLHDLGYGKYDAVIDTGPSYQTQRQEAAELQMELLKILGPQAAMNIAHLIVQNLGVPGSDEVARVLRKMLPDQLKSEEEKLADLPKGVTQDENGQLIKDGQPWQPPPTLEQQLMQKQQQIDEAKIQAEIAKADADKAEAEADKLMAQAKQKEADAKIAKAEAEMAQLAQEANGANDERMTSEIERIMREVMAEHEQNPSAHADAIAAAIIEALKRVRGYVDSQARQPAEV